MSKRLELHDILCEIINITEPDGDRHVYFQPPESVKMKYDAIRYSRKTFDNKFANNKIYKQIDCYEVIAIYRNPDSDIPRKILKLPMCRHNTQYIKDNLIHDVFTLYY